ncbi:MAG: hypothetical protein ACYDCN_11030 [Bacteroidia bacterium]
MKKQWWKIVAMVLAVVLFSAWSMFSQVAPEQPVYPKVAGYMSFIVPFFAMNKKETITNFTNSFTLGIPIGINIFYSDKFGFACEFIPTLKFSNGSSKMSNFVFDPGLIFKLKHGFAFVSRLAFETSGRYGVTPLITKVIKGVRTNYFVSVSAPLRSGNSELPTIGCNLQVGIIFK